MSSFIKSLLGRCSIVHEEVLEYLDRKNRKLITMLEDYTQDQMFKGFMFPKMKEEEDL